MTAGLAPWLLAPLDALLAERKTLHHALLVDAPAGYGGEHLALALAGALLCEGDSPDGRMCGRCPSCHWLSQSGHPDLRRIRPESENPDFEPKRNVKPSREIKIGQIRELADFVAVGGHRNRLKIIIIDPADALNPLAANALLKTLEEPPGEALFVLCARRADALAPTIRSRCRLVRLPKPDRTFARAWLAETAGVDERDAALMLAVSGGAPLRALRLAEPAEAAAHRATLEVLHGLPETDVASAADRLMRLEPTRWMPVLQAWIGDLARVCAGGRPSWLPEQARRLAELSARTRLADVLDAQSRLQTQAGVIDHPLNPRLYCEGALLSYCSLYSRSGRRT